MPSTAQKSPSIGQAEGTSDEDEKAADLFASEVLVPSEELKSFVQSKIFTSDELKQFAELVDIDVGILVGRLQHDGIIGYNQFNSLKKKYDFIYGDE